MPMLNRLSLFAVLAITLGGCHAGARVGSLLKPVQDLSAAQPQHARSDPRDAGHIALVAGVSDDPHEPLLTHAAPVAISELPNASVGQPDTSNSVIYVSIDECVQLALAQNRSVRAARQRVEVAAQQVPQARSLNDPMVSVQGWPFFPNSPQTASGRMTVDAMVSQQVPWVGKLDARARAAQAAVSVACAQLETVRLATTEQVKIAYYELTYAQTAIATVQRDGEFLDDVIETSEARYRAGSASQQDVLRLQAERTALESELIQLRLSQTLAQADLAALLHVSADVQFHATESAASSNVPDELRQLYDLAVMTRPELRAALAEVQRERRMVDLAQLDYKPDFAFQLGWGEMTTNRALAPSADGVDNVGIGLSMNVPIYRTRLDAGVRQAQARVAAELEEYHQLKDNTEREIKKLFTQTESQRQLAELLQSSIIPKTEQALEISLRDYSAGKSDFADLLSSRRELLRYRLAVAKLHSQLQQSLASLERVVGV